MKKLALIASLVAACGFVGLAQAASTGIIAFNGELTANTCDVIVDGQAASVSTQLTLMLNLAQLTYLTP
ncbi:hypothetical protein [Serratia aquatilis]|uniref:hypothetical protein n=1 Tax=Serratia aquatilis TaxID=1737515 RepID=UPI00406BBCF2